MKKLIVPISVGLSAMTLLTGCLDLSIGSGTTSKPVTATVGQQLLDLQKAKDAEAITDAEYQAQKTKILNEKSAVLPASRGEGLTIGVVRSAVAVHAASRRWLSFFRWAAHVSRSNVASVPSN